MAFPSLPVLDSFNRSDSSPISGQWARATGMGTVFNLALVSNHAEDADAVGGFTAASYWTGGTYSSEVAAFATMVSPADTRGGQGVFLDYLVADQKGYFFFWQNTYQIYRLDPGFVLLGSFAGTATAGDVLGGQVLGNDVTIFKNGVALGSATDTTYRRTANIGIYCGAWNNAMDNFGGGNAYYNTDPIEHPRIRSRRTSW
jgi:hypothetical protein